jgi:hypothetical protein
MEALPAGDAVLLPNRLHMGGIPMLGHLKNITPWNINAGLDTTKTHDTSIGPLTNQRSSIFKRWPFHFFGEELLMVDSKFIGTVLELTFSSGIADGTVQRMVDQ